MTMSRTINRVKRRGTRRPLSRRAAMIGIESTRQREHVLSCSAPRVTASRDLESEEPKNFRNVFGICINLVTSER